MKGMSTILILSTSVMCMCGTQQTPPVFIHHNKVQSQAGTRIKLHNYTPSHIDVTYVPQQVVKVKNGPTKLPLTRHIYSNGIQHLKCVLSTEHPQKKSDHKTLELLVRKEPMNKNTAYLLNNDALLKSHEAVIRLYRKVAVDTNPLGKTCWKPVLTLPETDGVDKIFEGIKISPDGKIHLENS